MFSLFVLEAEDVFRLPSWEVARRVAWVGLIELVYLNLFKPLL